MIEVWTSLIRSFVTGHGDPAEDPAGRQRSVKYLNGLVDCADSDCLPGQFTFSGQGIGNSSGKENGFGDVDGDGDIDVMVANFSGPNQLWLNDGNGNFTDSGQLLGNSQSNALQLGDLDGDGDLDAIISNGSSGNPQIPNKVWFNDGTGIFSDSGQELGVYISVSVQLADLDNDGDLDAFFSNGLNGPGQPNEVYLNDGLGNFTDSGQALGLTDGFAVLADLDNDGDIDAFVACYLSRQDRVWLNDGFANFTDTGQRLGNSISHGADLADIDNDGDTDAIVANILGGGARLWLNDGSCIRL